MKSSITVSGLVSDLESARLNCQALGWPVTTPADLPLAYRVALSVRARRIEAGETPAGYKIGFTNRNIWPRYAVYAPIWGTVWQGSLRRIDAASPNPALLSLQGLMEPRIEPEIVFCLREAPPPDCTIDQLVASFDWVAHGFEIVHTHFADWKFTAAQAEQRPRDFQNRQPDDSTHHRDYARKRYRRAAHRGGESRGSARALCQRACGDARLQRVHQRGVGPLQRREEFAQVFRRGWVAQGEFDVRFYKAKFVADVEAPTAVAPAEDGFAGDEAGKGVGEL